MTVPKSANSTRIWSELVLRRPCESTLAARIQSSLAFPVTVSKSANSTRIWSELVRRRPCESTLTVRLSASVSVTVSYQSQVRVVFCFVSFRFALFCFVLVLCCFVFRSQVPEPSPGTMSPGAMSPGAMAPGLGSGTRVRDTLKGNKRL